MVNSYSRVWFELFLETRPYTEKEIAFIVRHLPNPPYRKVLDLCCGEGRHTNILAHKGYEMVGIDLDAEALSIARREAGGAVTYLQQDMREIERIPGQFDAVLSLWQSFGYFDETTNRSILQKISKKLFSGGRFILDIYNRAYWLRNQGVRWIERKGVKIRVENKMIGNRLRSSLEYDDGLGSDTFEWQLYTLDEIIADGREFGLFVLLTCTEFNEEKPVAPDKPMMEIIFEKKSVS